MEWQGNLGLKAKLRLGGAGADYAHLETVVSTSLAGGEGSVVFPEENAFGGGGVDHRVAGTGAEVEVRVEHALVVGAEIVGDGKVAKLQKQFEVPGGEVSGLDPVRGAADFLFVDGELEAEFLAGVGGELGGGISMCSGSARNSRVASSSRSSWIGLPSRQMVSVSLGPSEVTGWRPGWTCWMMTAFSPPRGSQVSSTRGSPVMKI